MSAETKSRGGRREGSGRKPGKHSKRMTFSIPLATAQALAEAAIGNKSRFVSEAILKAIGDKWTRVRR
jgi:hypothetical protein